MRKITIRGGDLDLVEYEYAPFPPGEQINTLGFEKDYSLEISDTPVTVRVPARIHLAVLDMNRFAPNRPGGGGFGFALQLYSTATVACIPSGIEINYTRVPLIRHLVAVFQKVTGYTGGFSITVSDHEQRHVGLGSTGSALTAVAHAMNNAIGSPLSTKQLRLLVGHNYVEETATGDVVQGFETGVGPAAVTYGGMAVLGDKLTLISCHPFARNKNVFIIIPPIKADTAGEGEFGVLMNRARVLDYRDRELKAYMVLMDLIPALIHDDLRRVGDIVWEIQFRGSNRADVEHNSFMIYQYMSHLREAGFELVGMSSVGPTISVVTGASHAEVETVLKPLGLTIALETKVDNEGIKVI